MFISGACCVLSGRGLCVGLISPPEDPTVCGVSECDHEALIMKRPRPTSACCTMTKIECNILNVITLSFKQLYSMQSDELIN